MDRCRIGIQRWVEPPEAPEGLIFEGVPDVSIYDGIEPFNFASLSGPLPLSWNSSSGRSGYMVTTTDVTEGSMPSSIQLTASTSSSPWDNDSSWSARVIRLIKYDHLPSASYASVSSVTYSGEDLEHIYILDLSPIPAGATHIDGPLLVEFEAQYGGDIVVSSITHT